MKRLRAGGMVIGGSSHKRKLKNLGYYHGYKGYRFVKDASRLLPISSFDQIVALNTFDSSLKTLLYPRLMLLETALKNYTIEAILANSKSERLDDVWSQCVTGHRGLAGKRYRDAWEKRLRLRRELDDLIYNNRSKDVIKHFWEGNRDIPIWALCEVMTLGHFGNLYTCLSKEAKEAVARDLSMPTSVDSPHLLAAMIFALKDLRNAVAHNAVVFDVRFKTGSISKGVSDLLCGQMDISRVDFSSVTDYVLLVVYLMKAIRCSATECRQFVSSYVDAVEQFRGEVPYSVFSQVIPTDLRPKAGAALRYVKSAKQFI